MSSAEAKLLWLVVGSAGCVARPPAPKAPAPEVRVEPREPALVTPPSVVFPPGVEEWTDAEGLDPGAEPTDTDDDPAEPIDPPPVSGPADAAMLARRAPQLLQWKKLPAAERLAVARDLAKLSVIGACEPYFEETEDAAAVDMPSVQVLRADLDRDGDRDAIVVMRGLCFYHGVGEGGLVVRIGDIASRPTGIAARFVGFGMLEQVVHLD